MKYCPYCGAELPEGAVSFCGECGKSLPQAENKERKTVKGKQLDKQPETKSPANQDEGYDGYYDDVLPDDDTVTGRTVDKNLIKKIALLAGCVCVVIALAVLAMYFL